MLFDDAASFIKAPRHAVSVFGMSGVGKTRLSAILRKNDWFHYSLDYRIGTRYMGEHIVDNFKYEAMKVPFLRALLRSDSIFISSNITFSNLEPLSTYLGAPGNPDQGGLDLAEYQRRQLQHRIAEIAAISDIAYFLNRAKTLYGYDDFIADTGGSLIEVIDLNNPDDPVVQSLSKHTVLLYVKGTTEDERALVSRYEKAPKPMYYRPELLVGKWEEFKALHNLHDDRDVDPSRFAVWGFEAILQDRLPRYQALAERHGYIVAAAELSSVRDSKDFLSLMQKAISNRKAR